MKKILPLLCCCLLFAVGCQNQPASPPETSDGQAAAPAEQAPAPEAPAASADPEAAPTPPAVTDEPDLAPIPPLSPETPPPAGDDFMSTADNRSAEAEGLKEKLAHHNFVIKTVDGQPFTIKLPDGAEATEMPRPNISFGEWPFAGGKVCNNYRGQVEVEGGRLFMKNAASTMMLCGDTGLSELENMFYQMMKNGVEVKFGPDNTLTLSGDGHELVFDRADYVN